MSSLSRALLALLVFAGIANAAQLPALRVCADPNNLPFSNNRGEGFENRIAQLVARDLGKRVEYVWWPQRRGFLRRTLNADQCDVVIGLPSNVDLALVTRPYYRSGYVFVSRADRHLLLQSLDDPRLKKLKIGVQIVGAEYANTPPAHALANRGIVANVQGFQVFPGFSEARQQRILEAVVDGSVDVSIVWGPTAGYFAKRSKVPLAVTPFEPQIDLPFLPFVFDVSMAVRRGNNDLRDRLDEVIERRTPEIDAILRRYGVPRFDVVAEASQ
ncbi:MAG: substrate-binding domain-containing protein [Acidobacteria bacterium]|nr:substrate-binding domain-containing protein [Acidobacteriota bacterium]